MRPALGLGVDQPHLGEVVKGDLIAWDGDSIFLVRARVFKFFLGRCLAPLRVEKLRAPHFDVAGLTSGEQHALLGLVVTGQVRPGEDDRRSIRRSNLPPEVVSCRIAPVDARGTGSLAFDLPENAPPPMGRTEVLVDRPAGLDHA